MTFAYQTQIAIPDGQKRIQDIQVGNMILVCSILKDSAWGVRISWSEKAVEMIENGSVPRPVMIYHLLLDGNQEIVCSANQPFLLTDGKYVKAEKLKLSDQLVSYEGEHLSLKMISLGSYEGKLYDLAADSHWTGNPDGHLLLTNGVIAGDYMMQMNSNYD